MMSDIIVGDQFVKLVESLRVGQAQVVLLIVLDVEPCEVVEKCFFQLDFIFWPSFDQGAETSSVLRPLYCD